MYARECQHSPEWGGEPRRNATELDSGNLPPHSSQRLCHVSLPEQSKAGSRSGRFRTTLWPSSSEHIPQKSLVECSLEKVSSLQTRARPSAAVWVKGGCLRENRHLIYVCYCKCYLSRYEQWQNTVRNPRFLHVISNTLNHIFTKTVVWRST